MSDDSTYRLAQVWAERWTDEWSPCVVEGTRRMSARDAAVAILNELPWESIVDEWVDVHRDDVEGLAALGLALQLQDADFRTVPTRRYGPTPYSHVLAWLTAHLVRSTICDAVGHENDEGMRTYGGCWDVDDDAGPCRMLPAWYVAGDPNDLLDVALEQWRRYLG